MQEYPRVGVGIILFKQEKILLIRRRNPPFAGRWSLPGGKQEPGETLRQTASRELMEETGLPLGAARLVDVVDLIERDRQGRIIFHYSLVDYMAEWQQGEPLPGADILDVRWVNFDRLDDYMLWEETLRVINLAWTGRAKDDRS